MNNAEAQIIQQGTQIAILQGFVDNAEDHTTQQNTAIASLQESLSVAEADIASLKGAESVYELHQQDTDMAFFPDNDQTTSIRDKYVPCAVCRTVRSTVLMVPARTTCHDGWTLEYKGYLSAGQSGHPAASQYVYLDGQPEYLPGNTTDHNGVLFYLVEGRCGSLK